MMLARRFLPEFYLKEYQEMPKALVGRSFQGRKVAASVVLALLASVVAAVIAPVGAFPSLQEAKLTAGDGAASDFFGRGVAISGDTALVGAYGDDDAASETGSAYVFERSGAIWTQKQKLVASDAATFADRFGWSVDIDGDWLVVGAYRDSFDQGSAYIFRRSGGTWSEHQKLTASDGTGSDEFGRAVSISGNTVAVSAWRDDDAGSSSGPHTSSWRTAAYGASSRRLWPATRPPAISSVSR